MTRPINGQHPRGGAFQKRYLQSYRGVRCGYFYGATVLPPEVFDLAAEAILSGFTAF